MEIFKIIIEEILTNTVEVKAKSISEAIGFVEKSYTNCEIILDSQDHKSTNFYALQIDSIVENVDFKKFVLKNAKKMLANLSTEELIRIGFGSSVLALQEFHAQNP